VDKPGTKSGGRLIHKQSTGITPDYDREDLLYGAEIKEQKRQGQLRTALTVTTDI
jgi:hypothetical protein